MRAAAVLTYGADALAAAAASVLLVSGLVKVAVPAPITSTLATLWSRGTGLPGPAGRLWPGRVLGIGEVVLAAGATLSRSPPAAAALALFAAGLAAAGLMGALGAADVPCACFGGHQRSLGYLHVAQLPLWLLAAWSVASPSDLTAGLEARLVMLAACAAAAAGLHTVRCWMALAPLARRRIRSARSASGGAFP